MAGSSTPEYLISSMMGRSSWMYAMRLSALDLQRQDLREMANNSLISSVIISPAKKSLNAMALLV